MRFTINLVVLFGLISLLSACTERHYDVRTTTTKTNTVVVEETKTDRVPERDVVVIERPARVIRDTVVIERPSKRPPRRVIERRGDNMDTGDQLKRSWGGDTSW